jgi:probable O-glycosylation ligase (exosortase A-associated)
MGIKSLFYLIGIISFNQPWVMSLLFILFYAGLGVYAMNRPVAAVVLYFGTSIMNPQARYPLFLGAPMAKIAAGLCLISCLINLKKLTFRMSPVLLPMIAFLIMANIATFTALNSELANQRFEEFNKIGLMVLLTIWVVADRKNFDFLFWGVLGCLSYNVLKNLVETQTFGEWVTIHGVAGWIADSNDWALALAMSLPLFYAALAMHWNRGWKIRVILGAAAAGAVLTLTMTSSRGGFLAMAGSGLVFLFMDRKPTRAVMAAAAIAIVVSFYMPSTYVDRVKSIFGLENVVEESWNKEDVNYGDGEDYTGAERAYYWRVAYEIMMDHPMTGVGWGNFIEEFKRRENLTDGVVAHSTWFQVGSESGIPGLATFALMILSSLVALLRAWLKARSQNDSWAEMYTRAIFSGIIAFCLGATFISRENSELLFIYIAMSAILPPLVSGTLENKKAAP